ncbi:MAG: DUF692 family protein [Rickettsiales bacterium]
MKTDIERLPNLGFGLGLRAKHYPYILEHKPKIDWFEIISENFMDTDGRPKRNLSRIKEHYPIVMHGVAMSIGTVDPLNSEYLRKLKALMEWVKPAWISDHLCWTGVAHKNTHDLLPVPYTEEALKHIVQRIKEVQDYLECKIALENPSTYLEFKTSHIPEAEFIARMAEESDCNLLLDVNNVYVTCYNHRLDPKKYLDSVPIDKVIQIHLSGHTNKNTHIIDTHDDHVIDEVWNLYKYVVSKAGRVPNTMVEWDDNIPEFPVLNAELEKARGAAENFADYTLPDLARENIPQLANRKTSLIEEQKHMQRAVMEGGSFDSDPTSWIRSKESFAPHEQLSVYINAYRYRLNDVVVEDYPVLKYYLGEKLFEDTVWDFVNTARPDNFNIARYAAKFPEFVGKNISDDIFAYELCQLETAITQLADCAETEVLEQKHLTGMTPEKLMESVLYPRKALRLFAFAHQVNAYYQAVMDDEEPESFILGNSHVAVFRHEDSMWRMDLEEQEYNLLKKLFSGAKVGEALDNVDESAGDKLAEWFSRWINNGLLASHESMNDQEKHIHETA